MFAVRVVFVVTTTDTWQKCRCCSNPLFHSSTQYHASTAVPRICRRLVLLECTYNIYNTQHTHTLVHSATAGQKFAEITVHVLAFQRQMERRAETPPVHERSPRPRPAEAEGVGRGQGAGGPEEVRGKWNSLITPHFTLYFFERNRETEKENGCETKLQTKPVDIFSTHSSRPSLVACAGCACISLLLVLHSAGRADALQDGSWPW